MDTKSKRWKGAVSSISFILAVSLFMFNGLTLARGVADGEFSGRDLLGVLRGDYQETERFRRFAAGCLETFLGMAAGGPVTGAGMEEYLSYDGWYGGYPDEKIAVSREPEEVEENVHAYADGEEAQEESVTQVIEDDQEDFWEELNREYERWYVDGLTPEENAQVARRVHEEMKNDGNLLYVVTSEGKTVYTNAEGIDIDVSTGKLPDGYNFLMFFDGSKVSGFKNGRRLDFYGDGYYQEERDWYLPGYENMAADEEISEITVCMAFAEEPVVYLQGGYRTGDRGYESESPVYRIADEVRWERERLVGLMVSAAAMLLFFLIYLSLRREKTGVDRLIAGWTGKVWFEVKILACAIVAACLVGGWLYEIGVDYGFLWLNGMTVVQELGDAYWAYGRFSGLAAVLVFLVIYLAVNDLRYNPRVWHNSLCGWLYTMGRKAELKFSLQRRAMRRGVLLLVCELLLLVPATAAVVGYTGRFTGSMGVLYVIWWSFLFFSIAAVALQVVVTRENRKIFTEMSLLEAQIDAVYEGDYEKDFSFPEDSDLAELSGKVKEIRNGLDSALEEKVRSEKMKVELVSNVSHDLKTPLTSIISYVELLKQEELSAEARDYVLILDEKAQRLKAIVQDVFEVSKAASGQLGTQMKELDLGKLLRQTLADMGEEIKKSPVTVKTGIPESPVLIEADGDRLYRVFQNLIQNALQYSLEGSRVYVTLREEGDMALAEVKNTSRTELAGGMDYTERFVRGDRSRTDGGSGLGLSIARSFTEACGGKFEVETIADLFVVRVEFERRKEGSDSRGKSSGPPVTRLLGEARRD